MSGDQVYNEEEEWAMGDESPRPKIPFEDIKNIGQSSKNGVIREASSV